MVAATSRDGGHYLGQIPSYSLGAKQMRCALAALNRLTPRLDGLGMKVYTYAMLRNGQQTVTENGPWASDEVTVTNRHGRRGGLRPAQPSGGGFGFAALWRLRRNDTWYDGLLLAQERDGGNRPTVTYTRGRDLSGSYAGAGGIGGLLARSHGYSGGNWSSHTFYHADGNGTVTALVNSGGALQASYKYDPYGRWLSGGGSLASANLLRFSGKPWVGFAGSTTSGLYYYGYRFYDPYLQRWPNRDPINEPGFNLLIGSQDAFNLNEEKNLYAFVQNDPLNKVDPDGRWAAIICEALKRAVPHLAKCKNLRCKVSLHPANHPFPVIGKKCHIEALCYIKGQKNSHIKLRIPVPDFMCSKKKTPPTTPPAGGSSSAAGLGGETESEQLAEVEIE